MWQKLCLPVYSFCCLFFDYLSCTSNAVSLRMNRQNLEIVTIMSANDSSTFTTDTTTASPSAAAAGAITL